MKKIFALILAFLFAACSNYQEEFDNNFGALEYADDVDYSSPSGGDDPLPSSSDGNNPSSSSFVPTSSSEESSSSLAESSSSSIAPLSSYNPPAGNYGELEYKGQKYRTATIGNQEWMAENMNAVVDGSSCYKDSSKYCDMYGRLYSWDAAMKVCPEGWSLPSKEEWEQLILSVGGANQAGKALKTTSGWKKNGNGTDSYGFSALPAGYWSNDGFEYYGLGGAAHFWSQTESEPDSAYGLKLEYSGDSAWMSKYSVTGKFYNALSVRCLKDAKPLSSSSVQSSSSSAKSSSSAVSSSSITVSSSSVEIVKDRAGNEYPVVQIGEQYWMAENLNFKTENSYCYDDQESNCGIYGRLYTWEAAMTACPNGYKLPSQEDYSVLWNYANQIKGDLKVQDVLWVKGNWDTRANNMTGFSAYPGGRWNGSYDQWGREALFWTSTEVNDNKYAYYLMMDDANATLGTSCSKNYRLSVRCLKDSE